MGSLSSISRNEPLTLKPINFDLFLELLLLLFYFILFYFILFYFILFYFIQSMAPFRSWFPLSVNVVRVVLKSVSAYLSVSCQSLCVSLKSVLW